jgi:hypothetical protein
MRISVPDAALLVRRTGFAIVLAGLVAVTVDPAFAQAPEPDKFSISLGVFFTDLNSKSTIDSSTGDPGTDVDLEDDLGLRGSNSVFRIDGYYKFNERHRIDFSWFDLSRNASKQIEKDIEWNDTVFPINTTVNTEFDLDIYKLAYTWSFWQQERNFLGVTAGLYVASFGNSLTATSIGARESVDVAAPLPVIGLRGQYYFSDKWSFRADGELFFFEYEDWDGDLIDLYAGIDYQIFDNVSFGIGFNSVTIDLGVSKNNFTGNVDWGYSGALAFVRASF